MALAQLDVHMMTKRQNSYDVGDSKRSQSNVRVNQFFHVSVRRCYIIGYKGSGKPSVASLLVLTSLILMIVK